MKLLLLILLLVCSLRASAQTTADIVIGKIDSIPSKILNENRTIWVHVPKNGPDNPFSAQRFPVLYVLDGDSHFSSLVGMIQQLSNNAVLPEMIVVGILNTDRTRDLTPTHINDDPPFMTPNDSRASGGGGQFLSFIEKELIPHIDSLYPTQPFRTLVGHSFGGLAVLNALTTRPRLFNAYVCIDPSMWYDRQHFLKTTEKALTATKYAGITLYMGIANTLENGLTLAKLPKDTTADSRHIRSIFELDRFLKAHPQPGLRYRSKYYPDDSHGSAPLITTYDGLRFIFDFYAFKMNGRDYQNDSDALATRYQTHYANVSRRLGYPTAPPEMLINAMGYRAMHENHFRTAESLFRLNIANYPKSFNVYDSYADYFIAKKDKLNAVTNLKKALSLQENPASRTKLIELERK